MQRGPSYNTVGVLNPKVAPRTLGEGNITLLLGSKPPSFDNSLEEVIEFTDSY